jgi:hypothetical protein
VRNVEILELRSRNWRLPVASPVEIVVEGEDGDRASCKLNSSASATLVRLSNLYGLRNGTPEDSREEIRAL